MKFTFDSPLSIGSSAYDKAHRRRRSAPSALASTKSKTHATTGPTSNSFLANLVPRIRNRVGTSGSISAAAGSNVQPSNPTSAVNSLLFRLPLALRQKIYGYVVGKDEVLHILLKRKASHLPYSVAHRRCRAGGNTDDCIIKRCREFLNVADGSYFGSFDRIGGLLLTSRDM
jgi:hypothetical protein